MTTEHGKITGMAVVDEKFGTVLDIQSINRDIVCLSLCFNDNDDNNSDNKHYRLLKIPCTRNANKISVAIKKTHLAMPFTNM
jgi:hypothetical protein